MTLSFEHLPEHLAGREARGLAADQPIAQYEIGDFRNFVYLVLDWKSRRAALVDPQLDLTAPLEALRQHGFRLAYVLLTHTHHDHIAGVPELVQSHPEVPIVLHERDAHRLPRKAAAHAHLLTVEDDVVLDLGETQIRVMHTPGHSAGECCYFVETAPRPFLLTGDTVFIRDCGRTDFPDGSNDAMFESLQRIRKLPPDTVLLPGHHYAPECSTSLARELRESPPFRCRSVAELAALP